MSSSRPTPEELLDAVVDYLDRDLKPVAPAAEGYRLRIAIHLLRILARELTAGAIEAPLDARARALTGAAEDADAQRTLASAIRAGRVPLDSPELAPLLRAMVEARIAIDQPKYPSYADTLARGYPNDRAR